MKANENSNLDEHKKRSNQLGEALGNQLPANLKLLSLIGNGGFANVYKAYQTDLQKTVAVKILHAACEDIAFDRFVSEAQLCANKLEHPNIIRMYAFGLTETKRPYIVMQFVNGVNLATYCANTRYGWQHCLRIIEKVLSALEHAHKQGIIHRDLKPENILICSDESADENSTPEVFLCDFGLAKDLTQKSQDLTSTGFTVGTPAYVSPEQACGQKADARSDVYSMGCILYEMLSGRRPFLHDTVSATFRRHLFHDPVRLVNAPPAVASLVQSALEKDPGNRFSDAGEFLAAVRCALVKPNDHYRRKKFNLLPLSSRKKIAAAALAMTVFLGIAAGFHFVTTIREVVPSSSSATNLLQQAKEAYFKGLHKKTALLIVAVAHSDPKSVIESPAANQSLIDIFDAAKKDHDIDIFAAIDDFADACKHIAPKLAMSYRQMLAKPYFDSGQYDRYTVNLSRLGDLCSAVSDNDLKDESRRYRSAEVDPKNPDEFLPESWPANLKEASFQRRPIEDYCRCYIALSCIDHADRLRANGKKPLAEHAMQTANSLFNPQAARNDVPLLLQWRYYRANYYLLDGQPQKVPNEISAALTDYEAAKTRVNEKRRLKKICNAALGELYWLRGNYYSLRQHLREAECDYILSRNAFREGDSSDMHISIVDERLGDMCEIRAAHMDAIKYYTDAAAVASMQKPPDLSTVQRLKNKAASQSNK